MIIFLVLWRATKVIKVGDKIKFASVEEYRNNMAKSGRIPIKKDLDIQNHIAGKTAEIIEVENMNDSSKTVFYHTKSIHGDIDLIYFLLPQRFKKNNIRLSDDLFEF